MVQKTQKEQKINLKQILHDKISGASNLGAVGSSIFPGKEASQLRDPTSGEELLPYVHHRDFEEQQLEKDGWEDTIHWHSSDSMSL